MTQSNREKNMVLRDMGSFLYGGSVSQKDGGETFHGDHGYAQYYIPAQSRDYPIIFWHGLGQSGKCWESTPDGRDGFWQHFTRENWSTVIIDQPRRGRAARTEFGPSDATPPIPSTIYESAYWTCFRIGGWNLPGKAFAYPGAQCPLEPSAVEQFIRQQAPNTGDEPLTAEHRAFLAESMIDLLEQTGKSILFTHSHSGQYGWETAMRRPDLLAGVLSYEPGNVVFPEEALPEPIETPIPNEIHSMLPLITTSMDKFMQLTKFPIAIYYGDYIPETPNMDFNIELWRVSLLRAGQFVEMINRYGGNAKLIHLPKIGICGNSHNGIAEKNNLEIAALIEQHLHEFGIDGSGRSYQGPKRKTVSDYTIPFEK